MEQGLHAQLSGPRFQSVTVKEAGRWRATASSAQCAHVVWPDGAVIFQPWDGKLLAVSYLGVSVWRALLESGDVSVADLALRLLDSRDEDELMRLEDILVQLASLDLVACADH